MKQLRKVLIINSEVNNESNSLRNILESFDYYVSIFNVGRPQDFYDLFSNKYNFDYDYLIICCHGVDGKIIVPKLGEEIYYPNEIRSNIGYEEIIDKVSIENKIIISTGCTTGKDNLYKEFLKMKNIFIAPSDYIENNSSLLFVIKFFYHIKNNESIEVSYQLSSSIDDETMIYKMFK